MPSSCKVDIGYLDSEVETQESRPQETEESSDMLRATALDVTRGEASGTLRDATQAQGAESSFVCMKGCLVVCVLTRTSR